MRLVQSSTAPPAGRVCPWWLIRTFDNPLRRFVHNPTAILGPHVSAGQTAVDIGCGIGYFTMPLARLVGPNGNVIAADVQEKMLRGVRRRAERVGLMERITLHHCREDVLGIDTPADFVLAFWMVHEVPDPAAFLRDIVHLLKPEGRFLLVEPRAHVAEAAFEKTLALAREAGLQSVEHPRIALSRTAVMARL